MQFGQHALGPYRAYRLGRKHLERVVLRFARTRHHGLAVEATFRPPATLRGELHQQSFQHQARVPDECVRGSIVRRNGRGIDVDVHDGNVARRIFPVLGGRRARTAPNENREIGLLDDFTRRDHPTVRAHDTGAQRVRFGEAPFPAHSRAHRRIEQRRDLIERRHGAGDNNAPAADEDGAARLQDRCGSLFDRRRVGHVAPCGIAVVTALRPQLRRVDLLPHHVVG